MSNKEIQQQRMYRYFIDACQDLISEIGIENLTIRNISDKAGYNSATLYNYFTNLEELVALALLDNVKPYFYSLEALQDKNLDPTHFFLITWREYARYSFEKPQTFKRVFESRESDAILKYIPIYFNYFPSDNYAEFDQFTFRQSMNSRDEEMLSHLVIHDIIDQDHVGYLNNFIYALHLGLCERIVNGYFDAQQDVLRLFMQYLIDFFDIYSLKEIDKGNLLKEVMDYKIC